MKLNFTLTKNIESGNIVDRYSPLNNYIGSNQKISDLTVNNLFGFDFDHPIHIECQKSYDNSVNLILNDGKNIPRLINTRFSTKGRYQYEIVDRTGNTDTNLYNENSFQSDTSLFKIFKTFAKINLDNVISGGNLKVGYYVFYIKYSDADNNETNIAAQSGMCACYFGEKDKINGAYCDYNSNKQIKLQITNIDTTFDYMYIYYSRYSSDQFELTSTSCFKILDKVPITDSTVNIIITGNENTTEIPIEELNQTNEILDSCYTATQSNNTLFLGNVKRHLIEYENLKDLSLRIYPSFINKDFNGYTNNVKDIYNNVGYYPEEFYRFGIVYIYNNNTESPVFNIRGIIKESKINIEPIYYGDSKDRYYIPIKDNKDIATSQSIIPDNACGVSYNPLDGNKTIGIQIHFPKDKNFINELKRQGITGYYIVRQKRIPTILTQMYLTPMNENIGVPLFPASTLKNVVPNFKEELDLNGTQKLGEVGYSSKYMCGICPDYTVRQPYYNQLFTGDEFYIKIAGSCQFNYHKEPLHTEVSDILRISGTTTKVKLVSVKEDTPNVKLENAVFHSRVGTAEDLKQFEHPLAKKSDLVNNYKDNSIIVRGIYSPYIAVYLENAEAVNFKEKIVNVYIPGYKPFKSFNSLTEDEKQSLQNILQIRYADNSYYSAIGDKINFNLDNIHQDNNIYTRGDCHRCKFTQRIFRNFQDSTAPNNEFVIKTNSYNKIYAEGGILKGWENINRGDINAIKLGAWLTIDVLSTNNLNIRSIDDTYPSEIALTGNTRGYYPYKEMDLSGNNKIPESSFINEGFSQSLSVLKQFAYTSVPYLKNIFTNRIYYSNLAVNDGYQNGYRVFKGTSFRDYTTEYGQITKLLEFNGSLFIVFEHGIGLAPILKSQQTDQMYLNVSNQLPEIPTIISSTYGSIYPDSVIKVPSGIYGVDTTAKKVWRFNGQSLEIISELLIESFLQKNITFNELDVMPYISIKNCKTFYNSQKQDIMFTFYNNAKSDEVAWNICFNEKTNNWQTFYSWIPLFGVNINKNFLTFNRELNKDIIKFYYNNFFSKNQCLFIEYGNKPVNKTFQNYITNNIEQYKQLYIISGVTVEFKKKLILSTEYIEETIEKIIIEDATFGTEHVKMLKDNILSINLNKQRDKIKKLGYIDINFKVITSYNRTLYTTITIRYSDNSQDIQFINYLYKHGSNKVYDYQERILPTYWYGKQHPFEFEFVISNDLQLHKIFNKLAIIGNNAEPESFHYEITGDCYDFSQDKEEMYFRQEITKALYNYNGSNIQWDKEVATDESLQNGVKMWNITREESSIYPNKTFYRKSTIFPCIYYARLDYTNSIEDYYIYMTSPSKNYSNLAGAELVKNNKSYNIVNHVKAVSIDKEGRLRGNMHYQEDRLFVQINPINIVQKNESSKVWKKAEDGRYFPAIVVGNNPIPNDVVLRPGLNQLPPFLLNQYKYTSSNIDTSDWGIFNMSYSGSSANTRQEIKIKDKFIKIKVRYPGTQQSSIHSVLTYYTEVQ